MFGKLCFAAAVLLGLGGAQARDMGGIGLGMTMAEVEAALAELLPEGGVIEREENRLTYGEGGAVRETEPYTAGLYAETGPGKPAYFVVFAHPEAGGRVTYMMRQTEYAPGEGPARDVFGHALTQKYGTPTAQDARDAISGYVWADDADKTHCFRNLPYGIHYYADIERDVLSSQEYVPGCSTMLVYVHGGDPVAFDGAILFDPAAIQQTHAATADWLKALADGARSEAIEQTDGPRPEL